jgi:hypothetical protein
LGKKGRRAKGFGDSDKLISDGWRRLMIEIFVKRARSMKKKLDLRYRLLRTSEWNPADANE